MTIEHPADQGPDAFRDVPRTGVIYVMTEAARSGYVPGDPAWTNFGQGQPECGPLPGAPARLESVPIALEDHEYAPIAGIWELREAVAGHYNTLYRRGMPSQYSAENVCISPGGRTGLARAAASLGAINLGHFLPDYTAYEELLGIFRLFSPIPILLDPDRGYDFSLEQFRREVRGRGLGAILASNPCNPTGKLVSGEALAAWIALARRYDCALIFDEFYSHYVWDELEDEGGEPPTASAARHIEDVENDPVVIVSGLTKNWRYPGWRIAWTLGPTKIVSRLASAGSFLDGGACRPLQRAAIALLDSDLATREVRAIHRAFRPKRDLLLRRLTGLGVRVERPPDGTFYVWGSVRDFPEPINSGMALFRAALERQIICVPGVFFDVNPGRRRSARASRFRHHVRFSFGPPIASIEAGLQQLERLVADCAAG